MKASFLKKIKKITRHTLPGLLLLCLLLNSLLLPCCAFSSRQKRSSPEDYLRFHVIAASNKPQELELKNKLAGHLLQQLRRFMAGSTSKEEAESYLRQDKTCRSLEKIAQAFLREQGSGQSVQVEFQVTPFPPRFYQGQVLPPGDYLALRVIVGEGAGENWWCLLYPPLCFTPVLANTEEQGKETSSTLSAAEETGKSTSLPAPRFFIIEILKKVYNFLLQKISD